MLCQKFGLRIDQCRSTTRQALSLGAVPRIQYNRRSYLVVTQVTSRDGARAAVLTEPAIKLTDIGQAVRSLSPSDIEDDLTALNISYEMLQGPLARWIRPGQASPPTAVLVHGVMGNRKNLQSFAKQLLQKHPGWQILTIDLRCHGESTELFSRPRGPHTVSSAARDILQLVSNLKLFPVVLIGHSFGGKVVMSMVQQFGRSTLPRPVQVWALDSLPGEVRAGNVDSVERPDRLISTLMQLPLPIKNRQVVIDALMEKGFSETISRWAATNLKPMSRDNVRENLMWQHDLPGVLEMYQSYEETSMWPLLESPPVGLTMNFVKAERSQFRWGGDDESRILSLGHQVHLLENSGHWVHTDNPWGLMDILAPSFDNKSNMWPTRQ